MQRPISRLLAVSGAGGLLGAIAVGGPLGLVGGLLLGGFAEEVIARTKASRTTAATGASMGWDSRAWQRRRARLDVYGRPLPPMRAPWPAASYGADPAATAAALQAQLAQLEMHAQSGNVGQTIAQAAQVTSAVAQTVNTAVNTANSIADLLGSL